MDKNTFTPKQHQLFWDATSAGYDVDVDVSRGADRIYVTISKKTRSGLVPILEIWPDWTANRLDVDPGVAKEIRTIKEMRRILGLSV